MCYPQKRKEGALSPREYTTNNTDMQMKKASIASVARKVSVCAALLLCSCCLTSCSIIGSIISLPFRLLDAIF